MNGLQPFVDAAFNGVPVQASSDAGMLELWLNQYRPRPDARTNTSQAYDTDVRWFMAFIGKPLRSVTVRDLQAYAASLTDLKESSQSRKLSSIKSLIAFGHRLGYLQFDVGAPIQLPAIKDTLAERILTEEQMQRLLWQSDAPERRGPYIKRNSALVRLLYVSGVRISEVCGLRWRDLVTRDYAGQITVFGKGGKTRVILLPAPMWKRLMALRGQKAKPDDAVFLDRRGAPMKRSLAHLIVKAAVKRAKLPDEVSAHWFRHTHASHALDRGAPVHVVQATLGHASLTTTTRYTHVRPGDSSSRYLTG